MSDNAFLAEAIQTVTSEDFGAGCNQGGCRPPGGGSYPNGNQARGFGKSKPGSAGTKRRHKGDLKAGVRSDAVQSAVDKSRAAGRKSADTKRRSGSPKTDTTGIHKQTNDFIAKRAALRESRMH